MEVYVIATIKTTANILKGYRLIDIDAKCGIEIKDVTKQQLLHVLKNKILKIENAKRSGEKIMGIYSPIDNMGNLICGQSINEIGSYINSDRLLVLKKLTNNGNFIGAIVASIDGNVRRIGIGELAALISSRRLINVGVVNGQVEIKAKTEEIELEDDTVTDKEAQDKDVVWNISRFMKYMEQHGFSYILRDVNGNEVKENSETFYEGRYEKLNNSPSFTLSKIDKRCKVLHIPVNVTALEGLWEVDTNEIIEMDTIIIPKTVSNTKNIVLNLSSLIYNKANTQGKNSKDVRWLRVNNLWWQNDYNFEDDIVTPRRVNIPNIIINKNYNIPVTELGYNVIKYEKMYENSDLPYIPKFDNYRVDYAYLTRCFKYCNITGAVRFVDFNNIHSVTDSFTDITGIERVIIGNTLKSMDSCFAYRDDKSDGVNPEVDFTSKSLKNILYSFRYRSNINEYNTIDLGQTVELDTLIGSFASQDIDEFILPDSLENIHDNVGENVKNNCKIVLPESLRSFDFNSFRCNELDNLDWSKTKLKLINKALVVKSYAHTVESLIISDNFTKLTQEAFSTYPMHSISKAKNIEYLGTGTFINSKLKKFESSVFEKVKIIPDMLLAGCTELTEIAIESNITKIRSEAFAQCSALSKVFISDTVTEIEGDIFKKSGIKSGAIKLYVIKGSVASKKFSNRKNILMMKFDSYDEAYKAFKGLGESDEKQQKKFKLVMGLNEEYKDLMEEPYLSNCQRIMTIVNEYKADTEINKAELDQSKLDIDGPTLKYVFKSDLNMLSELRKNINKTDKLKDRFINYCNLLTSIGKNHIKIFKEENKEVYNSIIVDSAFRLCYIDYRCAIIVTRIKHINNIVDHVALIVIDDRVVWASLFNNDMNESFIISDNNCILNKFYTNAKDGLNIRQNNLSNYIEVGDSYNYYDGCTLAKCELPKTEKYRDIWEYIKNFNFIMVGCNKDLSVTRTSNSIITWYDLSTGDIITTKQNTFIRKDGGNFYGNSSKITPDSAITVTGRYKLDEVLKSVKSKGYTIERLVKCFNNNVIETHYKLLITSKEELDSLKYRKDAYDKSELAQGNLLDISNFMRTSGIKHTGQLNKELISLIFESGLCFKLSNKLEDAFKRFGEPNIIPISGAGGMNVLMEFKVNETGEKGRYPTYYIYAVTSMLESSDNVKVYMSYYPVQTLINKVISLSNKLKDRELHGITNDVINVDDFTFFTSKSVRFNYGNIYKLEVAIQNQTLETFIVANHNDMDYYTLFRFRNFIDADKILHEYVPDETVEGMKNIDGGSEIYSCNVFIKGLAYLADTVHKSNIDDYTLTDSEKYLDLYYIRELIRKGLPNNYPIITNNLGLLDKLAKQPK